MQDKDHKYLSRYKVRPQFKAGIHAGQVVITEVGKQKKEIVHHGDVLNTTSRIEGKCNELNQQLLISADALQFMRFENDFLIEEQGQINLKGKARRLRLFGVSPVVKSANFLTNESYRS